MADYHVLLGLIAGALVFAYMPGPALIYTAAQTIARGRTAGFMAALGLHLGCYVHVVAAAAGLSVLFSALPVLYMVVKLIGAGYLIWLGFLLIRGASRPIAEPSAIQSKSAYRSFVESMTVEILNPKTALFFLAFLPNFIDASAAFPVWLQFAVLGTLVNIVFSSADVVCVLLAGSIVRRLRHSGRAQRLMTYLGGGLMMALGVRLALLRD